MAQETTAEDIHWFLDLFDELGVTVWLDGGWCIDALLGEQTRPHADLDIMIPDTDSARLVEALLDNGFQHIHTDDRVDENFVMSHPTHGPIDFHVFHFDDEGHGVYRPRVVDWVIPASDLRASGVIAGRVVRCLSAGYQVRSHSGYALKSTDLNDMAALNECFGVQLLDEHVRRLSEEH